MATSLPVPERVTNAVFRSGLPKQTFVVSGSGIGTWSTFEPSRDTTVMPPLMIVARG